MRPVANGAIILVGILIVVYSYQQPYDSKQYELSLSEEQVRTADVKTRRGFSRGTNKDSRETESELLVEIGRNWSPRDGGGVSAIDLRTQAARILIKKNPRLGSSAILLFAAMKACSEPRFVDSLLGLLDEGQDGSSWSASLLCGSSQVVDLGCPPDQIFQLEHPLLGKMLAEEYILTADVNLKRRLEWFVSPFLTAAKIVDAKRFERIDDVNELLAKLSRSGDALPALMFVADRTIGIDTRIEETVAEYVKRRRLGQVSRILRMYRESISPRQRSLAEYGLAVVDSASNHGPIVIN